MSLRRLAGDGQVEGAQNSSIGELRRGEKSHLKIQQRDDRPTWKVCSSVIG